MPWILYNRIFQLLQPDVLPRFLPFFFFPKHFRKITRAHSLYLYIFFILLHNIIQLPRSFKNKQNMLYVPVPVFEGSLHCVYIVTEEKGKRQKITAWGGAGAPQATF